MYDFRQAKSRFVGRLQDLLDILEPDQHSVQNDQIISGFSIDTRTLKKGDLYFAIKGARVDGHEFVEDAMRKGAVGCIVERSEWVQRLENCICIHNTVNALGYLAASHRRSVQTKIIAVTGSVGKTTTKEILYQLLSNSFLTRRTLGNFNSTIGLPLQLLKLQPDDDWMVTEMGMSTPGEIATLMDITKPDAALWTSVQPVHLANFDSVEGIARAKAEMVQNMEPGKTLIYNMDDPLVAFHCIKYQGRKVRYSFHAPEADFLAQIHPFPDWSGTNFSVRIPGGKTYELSLPLVGRYNVYNAVAACTAAWAIGFEPQDFMLGMRQIQPIHGRSNLPSFHRDIRVVDDSYNANPGAYAQVLRSFSRLSPTKYRWFIGGDMLELGQSENNFHTELGDLIAEYAFDRVTLVGSLSALTYQRLQQKVNSGTRVEHFPTSQAAADGIDLEIPAHARIWIKGSRGIRLETVAKKIIDTLEAEENATYNNG